MSSETVTHRDMLRRLSAGEKRALTERSDWRGLSQLAGHLSLIGLCLWGNVVGEGAGDDGRNDHALHPYQEEHGSPEQ